MDFRRQQCGSIFFEGKVEARRELAREHMHGLPPSTFRLQVGAISTLNRKHEIHAWNASIGHARKRALRKPSPEHLSSRTSLPTRYASICHNTYLNRQPSSTTRARRYS